MPLPRCESTTHCCASSKLKWSQTCLSLNWTVHGKAPADRPAFQSGVQTSHCSRCWKANTVLRAELIFRPFFSCFLSVFPLVWVLIKVLSLHYDHASHCLYSSAHRCWSWKSYCETDTHARARSHTHTHTLVTPRRTSFAAGRGRMNLLFNPSRWC